MLVDQMLFAGQSSTQAGRTMLASLLNERRASMSWSSPTTTWRPAACSTASPKGSCRSAISHCSASTVWISGRPADPAVDDPSNRFSIGRIAVEQLLSNRIRNYLPQTIDTGFDILEGETA